MVCYRQSSKSTNNIVHPKQEISNILIESLTTANEQLVAGLAKQSLPKCQSDIFGRNGTHFLLFQGHNYRCRTSCGTRDEFLDDVLALATVLNQSWQDSNVARLGNVAPITNTLLERLTGSARFNEKDNIKLQAFADLCTDVDSQTHASAGSCMSQLPQCPTPDCRNASDFPKWEIKVVKDADKHKDAYPRFHNFASIDR